MSDRKRRKENRRPRQGLSPGPGAAAVTVLGLLFLVGLVAVALQPPGWLQFGLGAVMAVGFASFAGLAAQALHPDRRKNPSLPEEGSGQEHASNRRTA